MSDLSYIRNFTIIAHIDHGKSTLADRLIQRCCSLGEREMKQQMLDSMDIERERGITIKAQTVRLQYTARDGSIYQLNIVDTPGHVDFYYEVSRSLTACEGSILVVDASQGVEAQTLANAHLAIEAGHEILPVLNKIDLPAAEPKRILQQMEDVLGIKGSHALLVSAKTGLGIDNVLESIVCSLPPPLGEREAPLKALLIDSWYDTYLGVVILIRIKDGVLKKGQRIRMLATNATYQVDRIGYFVPKMIMGESLTPGEIGYITAGIKKVADCRIGDTLTDGHSPITTALPSPKIPSKVVFCGIFPTDSSFYTLLRESLEKLSLNDASFSYLPETSAALGSGFRCGFLGLLHMEIIQERLEREFHVDIITTAPSVAYRVHKKNGTLQELHNPIDMPDRSTISYIEEPWVLATILLPDSYLGAVFSLCTERRGQQRDLIYKSGRALMVYKLPLNEVVFDFHDRLQSLSRGYASFNYEMAEYAASDLVKITILVNGTSVDALAFIAHRGTAENRGRQICERLKELIPRHLFKIPIQAAIGGQVIARQTIPALRKDVTAKCYGGDITRKRKLLNKQREGKKKMQQFGKVRIPQSVFIKALRLGQE